MGYDLIALLFTLTGGVLMLVLPRKWASAPLLVLAVLMPLGQYVLVGGLHFYMTRILLIFGCMRYLFGAREQQTRLNAIDKVVILFVVADFLARTLLLQTMDVFINRLGYAYNILGVYFLIRYFVRDLEDMRRLIRVLALVSIVVAVAMLVEKSTGRNAFAVFGGVPAMAEVRGGRIRSQGPFLHSILAGTFGAAVFPLFLALAWGTGKNKLISFSGMVSAAVITFCSASSGPLLSFIAGIFGLCMWPLRKKLRMVRWGLAFTVIVLQLVMKAPVWALLARMSVVDGSTAYHRFMLVDQFIRRFGEWWLIGVKSTASWSASFLVMADLTNQYVEMGVQGGIVTLGLFVAMLALCFRGVGLARRAFEGQRALERLCWAIGAALFVHVVAFVGVSYFDQISLVWYSFVAFVSRLTILAKAPTAANATAPAGRASSGILRARLASGQSPRAYGLASGSFGRFS